MHAVIGWKHVLYQTIEHRVRAELKLSHHLPNCTMSDHLLDFSFFFLLIESEILEQESETKACKHARHCDLHYFNVSRDPHS